MFDFRSFASRKNPEAVVRAFQLAFPEGDEKAFLLIKTMGAEENCGHLEQLTELCNGPRISVRDIKLDREELIGLIRASDAFVSLHRSEGFNSRPATMLLGRPTIHKRSRQSTAVSRPRNVPAIVDHELIPVVPGEYPGVDGQRWADANVATAARRPRQIHERPDGRRMGSVVGPKSARFSPSHDIRCGALSELLERGRTLKDAS